MILLLAWNWARRAFTEIRPLPVDEFSELLAIFDEVPFDVELTFDDGLNCKHKIYPWDEQAVNTFWAVYI